MHPDIAALIGQAGSGPPPSIQIPAPGSSPADQQDAGGQGGSDPMSALRDAMDSLQQAEQDETDDIFSHQIATLRAGVAKLIAEHQKQQDGLMQGKASPQALRRSGSY